MTEAGWGLSPSKGDRVVEFRRILFPTDFSPYSGEAAEYAGSMVEKFEAELHLLHVLERHYSTTPVFGGGLALSPPVQESRVAAEKELANILSPQWQASHRVVRATAEGSPFLEIIRYAREHDIQLIVMGTHGRSGLAHTLMGSVAERVVRKSPCPVLTIRPSEHQFVMP